MTQPISGNPLIQAIIDGIEDVKGENITVLDLTEIDNTVCNYFIICDGNSNTQVNAIAATVERKVRKELSERPFHTEGTENAQWILVDYVSVVVHIFQKETRAYYDLESMWGDAKITQIQA